LLPRVSYQIAEGWRLRAGYLAIGGPAESLLGQFGSNDEFVLQIRYAF
jgi:hypothetical protein